MVNSFFIKSYVYYVENGFTSVGVFDNLDDLIVKSIEYWYCHYPLRNSWNFTAIL